MGLKAGKVFGWTLIVCCVILYVGFLAFDLFSGFIIVLNHLQSSINWTRDYYCPASSGNRMVKGW